MKRSSLLILLLSMALPPLLVAGTIPASAAASDTRVNVGSPSTPFSQNKQNEPALAVDADHPNVLVAGANDEIDMEACNAGTDNTCPFTPGVGVSGVYFSFDSGATWTQPTYQGWTARECLGAVGDSDQPCAPEVGPIGTLPKYFENGLVSDGDPALAFGPKPGANGTFSWANGSRLYYANLTSPFPGQAPFRGFEAVAVSRTDDVAAAASGQASAWRAPVIVTRQSSTTFSDKEQIWADNAASSPFFGHVYVCLASFRSLSRGFAAPQPLTVATSTDGGSTWTQKQVTSASNNPFNTRQGFGRSGCTVRTDSNGVVYVFANQFAVGTPGQGSHIMIKSFDGGTTWTRPQNIGLAVDTCFLVQFDGAGFRCVMDGVGGARDDLSSSPSVDIANGAPTGQGATNEILRTWVDGRDGVNHEHVFVSFSTDGGGTWSAPSAAESAGDRGYYSAIAISPKGTDAYLVYNAFTTPLRNDTSSPRSLVGVVKHADIGTSGAPGAWSQLHRGAPGDPRGSSQNNLWLEFLGDYVYAVATNSYGAGVWNDVRDAADCPAIDAWRAAAQVAVENGTAVPTAPAPQQDCPATFGNSDIFGGSFPDPTP
ncbi:MAG TPA: sialidase family protein [Streptosporangiaceae bacterium]